MWHNGRYLCHQTAWKQIKWSNNIPVHIMVKGKWISERKQKANEDEYPSWTKRVLGAHIWYLIQMNLLQRELELRSTIITIFPQISQNEINLLFWLDLCVKLFQVQLRTWKEVVQAARTTPDNILVSSDSMWATSCTTHYQISFFHRVNVSR